MSLKSVKPIQPDQDTAHSRQMRALMDRFASSGQNAATFCREQGESLHKFRYWRRRLGYRRGKRKSPVHSDLPAPAEFVRLGALPVSTAPPPSAAAWGFEVSFPNGILFRGTEGLALKGLDRIRRLGR